MSGEVGAMPYLCGFKKQSLVIAQAISLKIGNSCNSNN
jgi:hypothetical protein